MATYTTVCNQCNCSQKRKLITIIILTFLNKEIVLNVETTVMVIIILYKGLYEFTIKKSKRTLT